MKRRPLRAVAKVKDGSVAVYLDGVIDSSGYGDSCDAMMREQLARANGAPITLYVNCDGGKVTEGIAIYNTLRAYKGRKVCIITGIAASMGSVIPMACDEIRMAKGSFMMIHNPLVPATGGNADDLRKTADDLERMQGELLDIYQSRTGIERAKLQKYLDAETYFTAEEALAAGLIDAIEGELEASVSLEAVARLNPEKTPAALLALAKGKKQMAVKKNSAKAKELEAKIAAQTAELEALRAEGGEEEEEEEDEEEEEPAEDSEEEPHNEEDDDEKKSLLALTGTKSLSAAVGAVAALVARGAQGAVTARADLVTLAIKSGKMPPALKSWAMKCNEKTFAEFIKGLGGAKALALGRKHTPPAGGEDDEEAETAAVPRSGGLSSAESAVGRAFSFDAKKMISLRNKPVRRGLATSAEGGK
jgi:ATP-dependent Clp protease, protease subunit